MLMETMLNSRLLTRLNDLNPLSFLSGFEQDRGACSRLDAERKVNPIVLALEMVYSVGWFFP